MLKKSALTETPTHPRHHRVILGSMSKIFHAGECLAVFSDKIKHENSNFAPLVSTQILDDLLLTVGWLPVVLLFYVLFVHVHIYIFIYDIIIYVYIHIF